MQSRFRRDPTVAGNLPVKSIGQGSCHELKVFGSGGGRDAKEGVVRSFSPHWTVGSIYECGLKPRTTPSASKFESAYDTFPPQRSHHLSPVWRDHDGSSLPLNNSSQRLIPKWLVIRGSPQNDHIVCASIEGRTALHPLRRGPADPFGLKIRNYPQLPPRAVIRRILGHTAVDGSVGGNRLGQL